MAIGQSNGIALTKLAKQGRFNSKSVDTLNRLEGVRQSAASYKMPPLTLTPTEQERYSFGRQLFFDSRLSEGQQTSCSSCHNPSHSFGNGPKSVTENEVAEQSPLKLGLKRDIPPLINLQLSHWFFWDGRSDSLAAQAIEPLEHPAEHNLDRYELYKIVQGHYLETYESLFGPLPVLRTSGLEAKGHQSQTLISAETLAFAAASIDSPSHHLGTLESQSTLVDLGIRPVASSIEAVDQVVANIGLALEAFRACSSS